MNMKNIKFLFSILFVTLLAGCSDDDSDASFIDDAAAPQNISALFTITQDNSGLVTIAPHGEGVAGFDIYFGDGTAEPAAVGVGQKTTHTYAEGEYNVKVVGVALNGKTSEVTLPLTVSFIAPENLEVSIATVVGSPLQINVSATADYETYFEVMYGEDPAQEPVQFNQGDVVNHTYSATGTYTVTVTAFSGGAATTSYSQEVTITNPLLLPITFENASLNYEFTDFNGAVSAVIDNPDASGINMSATVASMTPGGGAWTGGFLTLDSPVDFADGAYFRVKVWSPAAGIPVLMKLENLTDGGIFAEQIVSTTVANQWEELVFNFAGANQNQEYSKLVFFFNAGNPGTGDTYYFDDISQSSASDAIQLPLTFESAIQELTWNNFGGASGERIANPDASGINTSGFVGQYFKNAGAETWAGIAIPMDNPIDFSTLQKVKMKVWSPVAGATVLMKFENMDPHVTSQDIEVSATTTVTNQWEELTFDFTGINNANGYQMLVLFFDFGQPGTGAAYYFDDVQLTN
tara:strand:+ start:25854 stop:27413 length:1560 start_codon:yes stop_codon:yes gene_type:complete